MMKKENMIKICICICLGIIFGFIGTNNVEAATYKIKAKYCSSYTYNYTPYYKYIIYSTKDIDSKRRFSIQYSTSPSRIVYCLQKGVPIKTGSKSYSYKESATTNSMYGNIAKAIAYGKNGTSGVSTCSNDRIATSMLVHMIYKGYAKGPHHWKTITNTQVRGMINKGDKASIASYFITLRNKVLNYDKMPFSGVASTTKSTAVSNAKYFKYNRTNNNFELSVSDSILNESWGWTVSEKDSGITSATISGGKLTVKAGIDTKGKTMCVRVRKTVKTGSLYASTATNQQTALLINPKNTYKYTYICFKSSYAEVKKVDAANTSKVLSGAKFRLYTDSSCKTAATNVHGSTLTTNEVTNSGGYTYFYNINDGTYYVKETQSPSQYVLDDNNCRSINISSGKGTVTFQNRKITSTSIQVFKNDKYDRSGIKGVKIGLYDDDKCTKLSSSVPQDSQIKTTDASGMVLWKDINTTNITTFPYYLYVKEEQTPKYYIKENTNNCKKVAIRESDISSGSTTEEIKNSVTIKNIPYGNLKILKLDEETREPLKNVKFKLLDQNKKEVLDKDGNPIKEITTDENGIATFKNVLYGIYYIQETKTDPKYKFLEQLYLFELNKNTDSIKLAKLAEIPYVIGDVTVDDVVNQDDFTELTNMLKDEKLLIGLEKKKQYSSDANVDGILDENDAKILEYYINYKDDIPLYKNSVRTLCNAKAECALDKTFLKNILTVSTIDDKASSAICYEPVITNPEIPEEDTEIDNSEQSMLLEENGDNTCKFTDKSLEYLDDAITNNTTSSLNADFNNDKTIDSKDSQILAAYLEYDKSDKITAVTNYLATVDKIGVLDASTIEQIEKVGTNSAIPSEEVHASIVITNTPIDMKISKLDITNAQEIKGAKIVIKDSKGDIFIEFTSTDIAKEFQIPSGTYTLTETVAPKGFKQLETEIKFRVGVDGNISIISGNDDFYELEKSQEEKDTDVDHLKIYNQPIEKTKIKVPDTGNSVSIITLVTGVILIGIGGYFIYRKYNTK